MGLEGPHASHSPVASPGMHSILAAHQHLHVQMTCSARWRCWLLMLCAITLIYLMNSEPNVRHAAWTSTSTVIACNTTGLNAITAMNVKLWGAGAMHTRSA